MVVNVNTASEEELRVLPGVGPKTAAVLVQLRQKYGELNRELFNMALGGVVPPATLELVDIHTAEEDIEDFGIDPHILLGTPSPVKSSHKDQCQVKISESSDINTPKPPNKQDEAVCHTLPVESVHRDQCKVKIRGSSDTNTLKPPDKQDEAVCHTLFRTTEQPRTSAMAVCHTVSCEDDCCQPSGEQRTVKTISDTTRDKRKTSASLQILVRGAEKKPRLTRDSLSQVRRTLENQRLQDRRRRNVVCCIEGCSVEGAVYQKVHAMTCHIPTVFDHRLTPNERINHLRVQGLIQVITWLLGRPGSLEELLDLVNRQHFLENCEPVSTASPMWTGMESLCRYLDRPVPREFTVAPLNSEAALVHWRVLYMLAALLQPGDRAYWLERFCQPDGKTGLPDAVDSHFHADRLGRAAKVSPTDMAKVLALGSVENGREVNLVGAVANFCDPDTFPTQGDIVQFPPEVIVSIGIHPKHADRSRQYLSDALNKLGNLLKCPQVAAVGEVGIDHSTHESKWSDQMSLLRKIVPCVSPDKVLVLHCREIPGNNGIEAHQLLLHLLKDVPTSQKIHLHAFSGSTLIVQWWLEAFPETRFSFNRGVRRFHADQQAALVNLKDSQILLETDAPYFCRRDQAFSAPQEIYDAAELVAGLRHVRTEHILRVTKDNALRLYGRLA